MIGRPLPLLDGAPVRLFVRGWTAAYSMKHLGAIEVSAKPFDGFRVKSAYRIPTVMTGEGVGGRNDQRFRGAERARRAAKHRRRPQRRPRLSVRPCRVSGCWYR
jgi:DMSO/TMAO reductase YedYZ molybdopterin-dependent catalytic subunit